MPSSALVRIAFGLLVLATVGAFFVVQRLKNSDPVVEQVRYRLFFSPNGDKVNDEVLVEFRLPERDDVTAEMVDERGDPVKTLAEDHASGAGPQSYVWEGDSDAGRVAPDGFYRLRVTLRRRGRAVTVPRELKLDTQPPKLELTAAEPSLLVPDLGPRRVEVSFDEPSRRHPKYTVWRTDLGKPRRVFNFRGHAFESSAVWNGLVRGRPAPPGIYAFSVLVRDRAGNLAAAPRQGAPDAASAKAGTGVSVRYLTAAGPLEPVDAGRVVRIQIGPRARRLRWSIARLGSRRPLASGRAAGRQLTLRVPRRVATGVHLVRIRAGRHAVAVPIAVNGRAPRGARSGGSRPLVVLPALSWQGRNPVDDDSDGFADTLDVSSAVARARPLAPNGMPAGFARETEPLLRFLDRDRAAYDLTTDLALARGRGPRIAGRGGLLFAGSARWLTEQLDLRLRRYVERGGRIASFGSDAFRRRVRLGARELSDPSPPEPLNLFGERTSPARDAPAPLVVFSDRIGMFRGTDAYVGLFSQLERSDDLVGDARLLAAAGREQKRPAFVAYELGKGIVVRAGTPEWQRAIVRSDEVATVTRRIWTLLSR